MKTFYSIAIFTVYLALLGCSTQHQLLDNYSNNYERHRLAIDTLTDRTTLSPVERLELAKHLGKKAHAKTLRLLLSGLSHADLERNDHHQLLDLLGIYLQVYQEHDTQLISQSIHDMKQKYGQSIGTQLQTLELSLAHHHHLLTQHRHRLDQLLSQTILSPTDVWIALQSSNHLNEQAHHSDEPWLDFSNIMHNTQLPHTQWLDSLSAWKIKHPNHPANHFLPPDNTSLPIRRVGLFLPQTGRLSELSEAIQQGFLSAHFQASIPLEQIKIYNSDQQSAQALYQQAQQDRMDLIIGFFDKEEPISHVTNDLGIPIIFLNNQPNQKTNSNHYAFDLSKTNEITQLMELATKQGYSRALIIHTDEDWSLQAKEHIIDQWQSMQLQIIHTIKLPKTLYHYAEILEQYLDITGAKKRAQVVKDLFNTTRKPIIEPSYDFDAVFLLTNKEQTQLVNPLISHLHVDNIAVFTTSMVNHSHNKQNGSDQMNHIQFIDSAYHTTQSDNSPLNRLKTIGKDLYLVSVFFNRLRHTPHLYFMADSGRLSIASNQIINQLDYFQFSGQSIEPLFIA